MRLLAGNRRHVRCLDSWGPKRICRNIHANPHTPVTWRSTNPNLYRGLLGVASELASFIDDVRKSGLSPSSPTSPKLLESSKRHGRSRKTSSKRQHPQQPPAGGGGKVQTDRLNYVSIQRTKSSAIVPRQTSSSTWRAGDRADCIQQICMRSTNRFRLSQNRQACLNVLKPCSTSRPSAAETPLPVLLAILRPIRRGGLSAGVGRPGGGPRDLGRLRCRARAAGALDSGSTPGGRARRARQHRLAVARPATDAGDADAAYRETVRALRPFSSDGGDAGDAGSAEARKMATAGVAGGNRQPTRLGIQELARARRRAGAGRGRPALALLRALHGRAARRPRRLQRRHPRCSERGFDVARARAQDAPAEAASLGG